MDLIDARDPRLAWTWGDRIRKVRRDLGMNQAEFAELVGYGEKAIAAWESGKNKPADVLAASKAISDATRVVREWLLGLEAPQ
jgi:DNA-binding transcriptional regulator YiaG